MNNEIHYHDIGNASVDHLQIRAHDVPSNGGAHHHYLITSNAMDPISVHHYLSTSNAMDPISVTGEDGLSFNVKIPVLTDIHFQKGPIKDVGVNGVTQEALIAICMHRLEGFQAGAFPSPDNAEALEHLAKAMACLQRRTKERLARGVEGTLQA